MTKEELKQEAEKKCVCTDEAMRIMYGIGYIDGAEPREKRIAELEQQIEKMKNCKNCKKLKKEKDGLLFCTVGSFYTNTFGKNCDKWEIKEK